MKNEQDSESRSSGYKETDEDEMSEEIEDSGEFEDSEETEGSGETEDSGEFEDSSEFEGDRGDSGEISTVRRSSNVGTVHCRHCGQLVALDAPSCVHCGSPSPIPPVDPYVQHRALAKMGWILLALITLVWIVVRFLSWIFS